MLGTREPPRWVLWDENSLAGSTNCRVGIPESLRSHSQPGTRWSQSRRKSSAGNASQAGLWGPAPVWPYLQALSHTFLLPTKLAYLTAPTSPPSSTRSASPLPSPGRLLPLFKPSAPGTCLSYQMASPPLSSGAPRHLLLDASPWGALAPRLLLRTLR